MDKTEIQLKGSHSPLKEFLQKITHRLLLLKIYFQILDFNFVQASVEHIKKIHDQAEKVSDKKVIGVASMWSGKMDRGPIDLLQRYSDILTNAFMALQYCPFQNTVPVALQTCLFMSKKILEALEALEKKEWTHEKIATTVSTK